jgi:hypothetical protein
MYKIRNYLKQTYVKTRRTFSATFCSESFQNFTHPINDWRVCGSSAEDELLPLEEDETWDGLALIMQS